MPSLFSFTDVPLALVDLARTETDGPGFVPQAALPSHLWPIPTIVIHPPSPEVRLSSVVVGTPVLTVPATAVLSSSAGSTATMVDATMSTAPCVAREDSHRSPAPAVDASAGPAVCSSEEMTAFMTSSVGYFLRTHRRCLTDEMQKAMGKDPFAGPAPGEAVEILPWVRPPPPVYRFGE